MESHNAALARRWFDEVWNQRKAEAIDELVTQHSVCYSEAGEFAGPEAFKTQMHGPFLAAFPDLHVEVEGIVSQGDDVVVRWVATGTHNGAGLGMPPTGRAVRFRGMTWIKLAGGKFAQGYDCWNVGGLMASLQS
jgi:steroid delta-isomerase-like uncharacterized protein